MVHTTKQSVLILPEKFLSSVEGAAGFDKEAFVDLHNGNEQVISIRFNPKKLTAATHKLLTSPVPWSSDGYYLSSRPLFTFDPLLHAGAYYVQEASSMFLEQALRQSVDLQSKLTILDLCAAPGGKSTLIQSLINDESLLVSNEVIKTRVQVLEENLVKWGYPNVIVTNNDPKDFAALPGMFDVVVIDAPCSGSGLFRKDPAAISEWSEENVHHCSLRQQRIISDAISCIKPGGVLIYSTCSYSEEEDEMIADWLLGNYEFEPITLKLEDAWGVVESSTEKHRAPGYRFYPDKTKGEGFFLACFRNVAEEGEVKRRILKGKRIDDASRSESVAIQPYLQDAARSSLLKLGDRIFAFPSGNIHLLQEIMSHLYIKKAGVVVGKVMGNELVPDHQLALSLLLHQKTVQIPLNIEDALQYLRKEEVRFVPGAKGWAVVTYEGLNLGWIKVLSNRVNNYYPKEWRILKSASN